MKSGKASFDVVAQMPALRRYALTLTRHAADADDLVHDTLVRAYDKRASFKRSGNLRVWLFSILHNLFIDRARSQRAEAGRLDRVQEVSPTHQEAGQDHHVRLTQVQRALIELPDEQRTALHLVAIEGLGYAEAAEALDIPVGTLMSRLSRARAALREMEERPAVKASGQGPHLRLIGGGHE